jgi:hypothetical protein
VRPGTGTSVWNREAETMSVLTFGKERRASGKAETAESFSVPSMAAARGESGTRAKAGDEGVELHGGRRRGGPGGRSGPVPRQE